jgi:hypothetical protein
MHHTAQQQLEFTDYSSYGHKSIPTLRDRGKVVLYNFYITCKSLPGSANN